MRDLTPLRARALLVFPLLLTLVACGGRSLGRTRREGIKFLPSP